MNWQIPNSLGLGIHNGKAGKAIKCSHHPMILLYHSFLELHTRKCDPTFSYNNKKIDICLQSLITQSKDMFVPVSIIL